MDKIALIGDGYWGSKIQKYLPKFFDLVYVANSKFDKNIIWSNKDINGVVIATPIDTHYSIAKEALENGKHVYVEKPISETYEEALELKTIADTANLKIGVEYTQTFSPSIKKILSIIDIIGELKFVEMSTKHLGRFMKFDVYFLLASHQLSILDMFIDLDEIDFKFEDYVYNGKLCTTGSLISSKARIDVSLNFPGKEMFINFYGSKGTIKYNPLLEKSIGVTLYNKKLMALPSELTELHESYSFDEKNNLEHSMMYFKNLINGLAQSNFPTAVKITRLLESKDRCI